MTTKYQITDSKGRVHKRTTKDRTYTHAVVLDGTYRGYNNDFSAFTRVEWAGRLDLAQKNAASIKARNPDWNVEIVQVPHQPVGA
jgi:hypothetical protein